MLEKFIAWVDLFFRHFLMPLCSWFLIIMILLTCYVVTLRIIFLAPPFWGDTIALFANIWYVMLAFAISIRERDSIAMQMLYKWLPNVIVRLLESLWTILLGIVGLIMLINGFLAARDTPGAYWELAQLPKSIPMMILPISGFLIIISSMIVFYEDITGRAPDQGQTKIGDAM